MALKRNNRIEVKRSIMHSTYCDNQKQVAELLGIKASDKKSLERKAKSLDWEIEWNEY